MLGMRDQTKKFHPLFRRMLMGVVLLPGFVAFPFSGPSEETKAKAKSIVDYRRPHIEAPTL